MKKYIAVPAPTIVGVKAGEYQKAVDLYSNAINQYAREGWSFHSMESVVVQEKAGCALVPKYSTTSIYMLIFEREE